MNKSLNSDIFCNSPWYEFHIYWNGGLGICCHENQTHKMNPDHERYNIKNMTIAEWYNSDPVKQFRLNMLGDKPLISCKPCYVEAEHGGTSRRHRSNQKSVIFTKQAFHESFEQSPGYDHFMFSGDNQGATDLMPIDIHLDLGNHCNLACKMCWPGASTPIATQYVKWGLPAEQYLGVDWTKDKTVWTRFLEELVAIPKLKNIHFMGGETLLSSKLEEVVDYMIEHKRFDVNFSFVTNGTVYKPKLIEKLKKFPRVGIEISIETTTEHNNYIRQGSQVTEVIDNIRKYKQLCYGSDVSVTLRPAISALSVGKYYSLLEFCLEEQLLMKSVILYTPKYLEPSVIPYNIRKQYLPPYLELLARLDDVDIGQEFNESDTSNYLKVIKQNVLQAISILRDVSTISSGETKQLVEWCKKWDAVYNLDAIKLYPELKEIFNQYGY